MKYDICEEDARSNPNCDDCGGFGVKEWDGEKLDWVCPTCFPKNEEGEDDDE